MKRRTPSVLDAGALVAVARRPHGVTADQCRRAVADGHPPVIPTVVFAQVWRDSPGQHALTKLRRSCTMVPFAKQTALDVGSLLAQSHTSDVVDAAVVLAAVEHEAEVITSDPKDLAHLADVLGYPLSMITIRS